MKVSATKSDHEVKVKRLELRASSRQVAVIRRAATTADKTVTAFVLDAAMLEAQRELADRRFFRVDSVRWQRFLSALDRPVTKKPRLRQLLKGQSASG